MKQPIAGVAPGDIVEVVCKVIWPTIGATRAGRLVGRLAASQLGWGRFFVLGKLLAVATIPLSMAVFFWQLMPLVCRRYALTNRRIIIRRGWRGVDQSWITWEDFDSITVEILPGQKWLHAGDLVFRSGGNVVYRLAGVPRPESLRQVCLAFQSAQTSVRTIIQRQAAEALAPDRYSMPVVG